MEEKDIKPENAKKRSSNIDEMTPEQLRDEVRALRSFITVVKCMIGTEHNISERLIMECREKDNSIKNLENNLAIFKDSCNEKSNKINRLFFERNFSASIAAIMTVAFVVICIVAICK